MSTVVLVLFGVILFAIIAVTWAVYSLFLIALPLVFLWLAWKSGRGLDGMFKTGTLQYVVPTVSTFLALAWTGAGYKEFKQSCSSVDAPLIHTTVSTPQDGFYVETLALEQYGARRTLPSFDYLLNTKRFAYYEQRNRVGASPMRPGDKYRRRSVPVKPGSGLDSNNTDTLQSKYVFTVLEARRLDRWWMPPVHTITYGIRERATRRVMAEAKEHLFGGWLFGLYFGAKSDRKERAADYLSCGYGSTTIGTWRPMDHALPEYQFYLEADAQFLQQVLRPAANSGQQTLSLNGQRSRLALLPKIN